MKNTSQLLLVVFIGFFTCITMKGQNLDFGIKAGANFSNLSDAESLDFDSKTGVTAGLFVAARFNMLSVQAELLYSQQGAESSLTDIEFDYVQLPILAKLHFLRILNLQFGPQFGYLANYDDYENSEKLDFSLLAGVGAHLGQFRIDARYNFGLTNPFNNEAVNIDDFQSAKNEYFSLAIGYSFL
ncbi:porin family protein [Psychroflexus sp. ALD_RP9]|uniref:porin family protein n=1 Tax=Psychroflexus sp. ALD_RP9 TaxID=2777186 RepID=UPI001A8D79AE|nr:porin family protein [Psychroflexus sp. ALD_RP9]QSS97217.1 PorT family protein [Psychroflexus sp. ALD_RP9]